MKKFLLGILTLIAVIAMAVCVAACNNGGSGDDKDPARMAEVAGNYYVSYVKLIIDGQPEEELTYTQDNSPAALTLNADGTGTMSTYGASVSLTWTANGDTLKYTAANTTSSLVIEGNTLKFEATQTASYEGETHTMTTSQIYTKAE